MHYQNAKPCAGVLITRDGRLLLGRRAGEPRKGAWDVIGGFLEPDEIPEQGAVREAREETGLDDVRLVGLAGMYVDRYGVAGSDDPGYFTLNVYFHAVSEQGEPEPSDDVTELRWFEPDALPPDLAFEHEHALLADWRDWIVRGSVAGSAGGFVAGSAGGDVTASAGGAVKTSAGSVTASEGRDLTGSAGGVGAVSRTRRTR